MTRHGGGNGVVVVGKSLMATWRMNFVERINTAGAVLNATQDTVG